MKHMCEDKVELLHSRNEESSGNTLCPPSFIPLGCPLGE